MEIIPVSKRYSRFNKKLSRYIGQIATLIFLYDVLNSAYKILICNIRKIIVYEVPVTTKL